MAGSPARPSERTSDCTPAIVRPSCCTPRYYLPLKSCWRSVFSPPSLLQRLPQPASLRAFRFARNRSAWVRLSGEHAYNHQPRIIQAVIPLAGPVSLAAVAFVLVHGKGLSEVLSGFRQIFVGSLQPLSVAQAYISATQI